jgi:hypothetical protein
VGAAQRLQVPDRLLALDVVGGHHPEHVAACRVDDERRADAAVLHVLERVVDGHPLGDRHRGSFVEIGHHRLRRVAAVDEPGIAAGRREPGSLDTLELQRERLRRHESLPGRGVGNGNDATPPGWSGDEMSPPVAPSPPCYVMAGFPPLP